MKTYPNLFIPRSNRPNCPRELLKIILWMRYTLCHPAHIVTNMRVRQVDIVARRLSELALTESALCLQTRRLSQNPKLTFSFTPNSLDDPPAPLQLSDKDSSAFSAARDWFNNRLYVLRSLEPLGNRDLDRRRWALIQEMVSGLESMSAMERVAWEREKVLAGLYGLPDQKDTSGPRVYSTGEHNIVTGGIYS